MFSGLTSPDEREKSSSLESGDQHTPVRVTFLISLPQILLPSTLPTMTAPSSYTMQILWPSVFHAMPRTTDLLRLLIISSYLTHTDTQVGKLWKTEFRGCQVDIYVSKERKIS